MLDARLLHPDAQHVRVGLPVRMVACAALTLVILLAGASSAWAAPANDDFASATSIAQLPFTDSLDPATATTEAGEPQFCVFAEHSVWYAFTATHDGALSADTAGSSASAVVTAYRADGDGLSGLSWLGCANFGNQRAVFEVSAGETYYLQASSFFGSTGMVRVNLEEVLPPANDDFAAAQAVGATPFATGVDLTAATLESSEPASCQGNSTQGTAWYAFTPQESGSYVLRRSDGFGMLAAYTGSAPGSLTPVACSFGQTFFRAEAGTTYHLQVGRSWAGSGPLQVTLEEAPDAVASFYFYPSDPSMFETVSFYDATWDPAGIASRTWRLGDGFTSTDCCVAHRYGADGDYAARLDVTTADGRSASMSQTVHVRTHDVAISKLTVPQSARAGQTRQLAVAIANTRFDETVEVRLMRSVPGGFEQVGQVTQAVPARSGGRTTSFNISYTFSHADASLGKVSFQAVATLVSARDAVPADNTVTALPTKVAA